MAKHRREPLPVIGWREWVSLGELHVPRIKVKVDTGARTSSLHAYEMAVFTKRRDPWVRFIIHPFQEDSKRTIRAESRIAEWRRVKSSNGKSEQRPVIITDVSLFGETWPIELTLTNRDQMGFRILFGRQALRDRFTVDAARSFLGGESPTKKS